MNEEKDAISNIMNQGRNIGYYAGLTFGAGYSLTIIGVIIVIVEVFARLSPLIPPLVWSYVPVWLYAGLFFYFIGLICAIIFGLTIIENAKMVKMSDLNLETIASSVSIFSYMLLFYAIGAIIIVAGFNSMDVPIKLSLVSPICGLVGPILLLIGFRAYQGKKTSESKFIGAILMLVSLILIYIVSRRLPDFGPYAYLTFSIPMSGPLASEVSLEFIALLIALVGALLLIFQIFREEMRQIIAGIILSISGILFSVGVIYFNFSSVSIINNIISMLGLLGGYGSPIKEIYSLWIVIIGLIILGIAGIIALVTAVIPLLFSVKQLSTQMTTVQPKPEVSAPTQTAGEIKYCQKCGTSMSSDALYCPKCGQKQPKT